MDVMKYLEEFSLVDCPCGRAHKTRVKKIISESGAINKLPALVKEYGGHKVFILADKNTFKAGGEKAVQLLENSGITCSSYVFTKERLEPDEQTVGSAIMHFDNSVDVIVAVGSGVINDVAKILCNLTGKPYFIVATAPSMDGYASDTSSMIRDGVKVSIDSKCAEVIIGDVDVLKNAPEKMLYAGLGDVLAKYVSLAEWQMAKEITGEYYCERVLGLVRTALNRVVDNAKGLINRDEVAVKAVFDGLVLSGVAMAFAGVSRPASGVEHYLSHVWDMRSLEFGTKMDLHGIQCGIATYYVAGVYEKLIKETPDISKAIDYVKAFDYNEWAQKLYGFLGKVSDTMVALEKKEGKYDVDRHSKRIKTIVEKWETLKKFMAEIPSKEKIGQILDTVLAPKTMEEVGIDADLSLTVKATKDIRNKYVLSHLLWDLGLIDEYFPE